MPYAGLAGMLPHGIHVGRQFGRIQVAMGIDPEAHSHMMHDG